MESYINVSAGCSRESSRHVCTVLLKKRESIWLWAACRFPGHARQGHRSTPIVPKLVSSQTKLKYPNPWVFGCHVVRKGIESRRALPGNQFGAALSCREVQRAVV